MGLLPDHAPIGLICPATVPSRRLPVSPEVRSNSKECVNTSAPRSPRFSRTDALPHPVNLTDPPSHRRARCTQDGVGQALDLRLGKDRLRGNRGGAHVRLLHNGGRPAHERVDERTRQEHRRCISPVGTERVGWLPRHLASETKQQPPRTKPSAPQHTGRTMPGSFDGL